MKRNEAVLPDTTSIVRFVSLPTINMAFMQLALLWVASG